jgi:eukaryotic-like serine/threonine-protein kinase
VGRQEGSSLIGTVIAGRYTLEAEIGRGGMGAVWRGRDEVLNRTVALKKIGVAPGGITPDARRAEREAKLAAKLNHANVVAVFDLVEESSDGQSHQWLVMEYVEGIDLSELIRQRGRLTPDDAAPILAQVASALAAAHGAGIVHRDVKPSNILVAPDGQVKLSDFGIARTSGDPALTQTGLVTGSPAYLSPEVASGQQATAATDVWSWGATLFHALEGRPPYQVGDNLLGALYRIVHEEPPVSVAAGWLAPVLAATMTRDPRQRWPMVQAQRFVEAGPETQPVVASIGGLADIGLAGFDAPEPRRTRSYDDGATQVLPLGSTTSAPPPTAPAPQGDSDPDDASRRPWLLILGATLALVIAMTVAFAIGLRDGGTGDNTESPASPSTDAASASSSSNSAAEPTEAAMVDFVENYIATASSDPAAAFDMLTPAFQQQSGGMSGYVRFWGDVRSAEIVDISADPAALEVSYTYRYHRPPGGPTEDDVVLKLTYEDGRYLIDREL